MEMWREMKISQIEWAPKKQIFFSLMKHNEKIRTRFAEILRKDDHVLKREEEKIIFDRFHRRQNKRRNQWRIAIIIKILLVN
jgi:hypothetical protein